MKRGRPRCDCSPRVAAWEANPLQIPSLRRQDVGRKFLWDTTDFDDGGFVQMFVGGNVSTTQAIEYVEIMIALKKTELARIVPPEVKP